MWYGNMLRLINGLRQAVDHPLNLFPLLRTMPRDSIEKLQSEFARIKREASVREASVYEQIYEQVQTYQKHQKQQILSPEKNQLEMEQHFDYLLGSQDNNGCTMCQQDSADAHVLTLEVSSTIYLD